MEEKRQAERRSVNEVIQYSVTVHEFKNLKKLNLRGEVIDISDKGIGIKTDYPLQRGHVITFNNGMGRTTGIVEWCVAEGDNEYRVGIRFV